MTKFAEEKPPAVNFVWIISGLPAAGKSTTVRELASRYPRAAAVRRDDLQAQLVAGGVRPGDEPLAQSEAQIDLNIKNSCLLARSYAAHGFVPICEELVGTRHLPLFQQGLAGLEIRLVTLDPAVELVIQRDKARAPALQYHKYDRLADLKRQIDTVRGTGLRLDNTGMTVAECVDDILANFERGC